MEEKKNKIIWLFFALSLILFARAFLSLINVKSFSLDPLMGNKYNNYSSLLANNPSIKERLIDWMIFLNKEDSDVYLFAGDYFQKKEELAKAAEFYQKAIDMAPLLNFDIYQKLLKNYDLQKKEGEKEKIILILYERIKNKGYLNSFSANLSKNLYLIGKEYFQKGDGLKTTDWWEKTIVISPEWSYFYLELASLYYQNDQVEKAEEILKRCVQREEPQEHCQQYLNNQLKQFEIEKPGFWQKEILKIELTVN